MAGRATEKCDTFASKALRSLIPSWSLAALAFYDLALVGPDSPKEHGLEKGKVI